MGKGVVNGTAITPNNSSCYSTDLVNYTGVAISVTSDLSLDITNASAALVWQDVANLISDISINGNYLEFYISPDNIRQGNAIIAVKDSQNLIMWSWHIWVTTREYGDDDLLV